MTLDNSFFALCTCVCVCVWFFFLLSPTTSQLLPLLDYLANHTRIIKVGTLDELVALSDELLKQDSYMEGVTNKLSHALTDMTEDRSKVSKQAPIAACLLSEATCFTSGFVCGRGGAACIQFVGCAQSLHF